MIQCECGFAYSEEFYKLYQETVDAWHAREHDGNLMLQLRNHILETLDRLGGDEVEWLDSPEPVPHPLEGEKK